MAEETKKSKFSSGLNIITRLDVLWRKCHELKRNGRYADWNEELDTIWLELARDLSTDEIEGKTVDGKKSGGYLEKMEEFDLELKKTLPFNDTRTSFTPLSNDVIKRRDEQYKILMKKQLFLAKLENTVDKGTTFEDEDDDF